VELFEIRPRWDLALVFRSAVGAAAARLSEGRIPRRRVGAGSQRAGSQLRQSGRRRDAGDATHQGIPVQCDVDGISKRSHAVLLKRGVSVSDAGPKSASAKSQVPRAGRRPTASRASRCRSTTTPRDGRSRSGARRTTLCFGSDQNVPQISTRQPLQPVETFDRRAEPREPRSRDGEPKLLDRMSARCGRGITAFGRRTRTCSGSAATSCFTGRSIRA
jgi:hypothetical protein